MLYENTDHSGGADTGIQNLFSFDYRNLHSLVADPSPGVGSSPMLMTIVCLVSLGTFQTNLEDCHWGSTSSGNKQHVGHNSCDTNGNSHPSGLLDRDT